MKDDLLTIAKGALLHDIGKVVQRASDNPTAKRHSEWGHEWLEQHLPSEKAAMLSTIAHHYTKEDDYAFTSNTGLIWYQADNLSSAERKKKETYEEGKWHSEVALASPFTKVDNPDKPGEHAPPAYLPLVARTAVPQAEKEEPKITRADYKALLGIFERDLDAASEGGGISTDALLMLLEKHFSTVPSMTMKFYGGLTKEEVRAKHPDISLYDHLKLTAAIAACMYRFCTETYQDRWSKELLKAEILVESKPGSEAQYLLLGGDISGVQRFIYTMASKGALKSLKGRSFFLELLTEHVVSGLLKDLGLTRCNLVFSGGGHFYILSHHTQSAKTVISSTKQRLDEYLLAEFKGALQLHLEYVSFDTQGFHDASDVWNRLSQQLEKSKTRKWQNRLGELLAVEMPHEVCRTQSCEVCFREDVPLAPLPTGEEDLEVCEPCLNQYQLGRLLSGISRKQNPVLYKLDRKPADSLSVKIDETHYIFAASRDERLENDAVAVYRINDLDPGSYRKANSVHLALGIYQHEQLQDLSDAASGFGASQVAVLRMDVDNLSKVFF